MLNSQKKWKVTREVTIVVTFVRGLCERTEGTVIEKKSAGGRVWGHKCV